MVTKKQTTSRSKKSTGEKPQSKSTTSLASKSVSKSNGKDPKPGPKKKLLNIIIRTHRRPAYFQKCLKSITENLESCKNDTTIGLHIICDDKPTRKYAGDIIREVFAPYGSVDNKNETPPMYAIIHEASPNQFSPADNYDELLKKGLVKKTNRDRGRHFYDLYINSVIEKINDGWIWIIDDDKEVAAQNTIAGIMAKIEDTETLLISQHALSVRTVPDGQYWNKLPFTRGQVDMASFIFHASKKHLVVFDGHGAGDWRVANNLAENLKPLWHKQVTTTADNPGNQGKTEI